MAKLTLEELKQMSGQPVWCKDLDVYGIIKCESKGRWKGIPFLVGVFYSSEYGTAYNFEYDIQKRKLACYAVINERDIPKKPIDKTKPDDTASRAYENCNIIVCPTCSGRLKLKSKGNYCDKCGQKLDWGKE